MITEVQLRLSPKDASDAGTVKNAAARAAGVKHNGVNAVQVLRRSIDARGRNVTIQMSAVVFSGSDFPEKTPPAEYPTSAQRRDNHRRFRSGGNVRRSLKQSKTVTVP